MSLREHQNKDSLPTELRLPQKVGVFKEDTEFLKLLKKAVESEERQAKNQAMQGIVQQGTCRNGRPIMPASVRKQMPSVPMLVSGYCSVAG